MFNEMEMGTHIYSLLNLDIFYISNKRKSIYTMDWRNNWKITYDHVPKTSVNPNKQYPVITNIVFIVSLKASIRQIDLTIGLSPTVRFGPTFAAAIVRQKTATILVSENGNLVATGCKSTWQSILVMHELLWSISGVGSVLFVVETDEETGKNDLKLKELLLGEVCDLVGYKIVNIVVSGMLLEKPGHVDLNKMHREDHTTRYNPDAFSGLWKPIRYTNNKGVRLSGPVSHIFDPGTFVAMGFKNIADVDEAYEFLKQAVKKYPDENAPSHPSGKYEYRVSKFNQTRIRNGIYL